VSEGLLGRIRRVLAPEPRDEAPAAKVYRIRLVVGLGNPGGEYAGNRHTVGFWTVNRLARRHGIELDHGGQASVGRGRIGEHDVAVAKPRTFVNKSGAAVWDLIKRLDLEDARELLVVYDEIDLLVGKVRLRARGGSGGQRGIQSIIDAPAHRHRPAARQRRDVLRPGSRGRLCPLRPPTRRTRPARPGGRARDRRDRAGDQRGHRRRDGALQLTRLHEHPNATVIRALYSTPGGPEAAAHLFHDDAVWHLPGRHPMSGVHEGRDAVLTAMRYFQGIQLELHDVVANDTHAVALLRARGERKGRRYEALEVDVFHLRGGGIAEFWSLSEDQRLTDRFWA
jgi:ketosteroid isomerase-like protein